jgi:hypothetical protein
MNLAQFMSQYNRKIFTRICSDIEKFAGDLPTRLFCQTNIFPFANKLKKQQNTLYDKITAVKPTIAL